MKLAFIDKSGDLFSVVWTVMEEGHDVAYFTTENEAKSRKIGSGLVPRVDSLKEIIEWVPDICVLYNVPGVAARLETMGVENFGSSESGRIIEEDRLFACELVKQFNVGRCPETHRFKRITDARRFIENSESYGKNWVFKADGSGGVDTSTTHVSQDRDHLLEILDFEETLARASSFVLQERVNGINISIEGWFHYKTGWIEPINSTIEFKHLMNGDNGPMMGCMGSIVWPWPQSQPKLFRQTLFNLTQWLTRHKYKAPLDGNFIIDYNSKAPYFLEFTPRFGWNAFEAVMSGFKGSIGEFFVNFGRGTGHSMGYTNKFCGAVRCFTPAVENSPIRAPIRDDPRLFPKDIFYDEKSKVLRAVGVDVGFGFSPIFEAGAAGETIKEVTSSIYGDVIPQITATDLTYRTDIGDKVGDTLELLREFGYISSIEERKRDMLVPKPELKTNSQTDDNLEWMEE